jgi:molybdenum cofactor guanylyltransferase
MKRYEQVSAFILCGGASSRMGKAKGLLDFGGQPLIVRLAQLVEPLVSAVTAVGTHDEYAALGLPVIQDGEFGGSDETDGKVGPLAGIATALIASRSEWNLILACDLPYLTREWLNWLLGYVTASAAQIVIPKTAGGLEPLAAVYRKECADSVIAALRRGTRKVTDAIAALRVQVVSEVEWQQIDRDGRVLRNMNTPQDYQEARIWLDRARSKPVQE